MSPHLHNGSHLCAHPFDPPTSMRLSVLVTCDGNGRCYSALGDVSKAQYVHGLRHLAVDSTEGSKNYQVRARLAVLNKQFKRAEAIYLERGKIDQAIDMYRGLHKVGFGRRCGGCGERGDPMSGDKLTWTLALAWRGVVWRGVWSGVA